MNEKLLSLLTRVAIILTGICGLLFCLFWIPISIGSGAFQNLPWGSIDFLVPYIFNWVVALPCFGILVIAWRVTSNMNNGKFFLEKNALHINHANIILFVDILVFLIGNIIFAILGWNAWLLLHILIAMTGLVISIFLYILSKYLMRAAVLQEESDLTV